MPDLEFSLKPVATYVSEFSNALVYSAVASPYEGVRQLATHCGVNVLPPCTLVDKPKQVETGTTAWYAQQLGGSVGIALDYVALSKATSKMTAPQSVTTEAAAMQSWQNCARRGLETSNWAFGGIFDFVTRPVADDQTFWSARFQNMAMGGATFAVLGGTDVGLKVIGNKIGSAALKDSAIRGVLTGGLTGVASSIMEKRTIDGADIFHKGVAFAAVNGLFGLPRSSLFAKAERPAIPAHEASGFLPPGDHEASWSDFQNRFATNEHRQNLLQSLHTTIATLKSAGGQRVMIGGSYVTTKELPGDIDVIWSPVGVDRKKLSATEPLFDATPAEQKAKLGLNLFPNSYHFERDMFTTEVFQFSKDKRWVGIVGIDLTTFPAVLSPTAISGASKPAG